MLRALVLPCLPECQHSTSFPSTVKLPSGEPCCIVAVHHGFKTLSWNHMEKQSCARPSGLFCLFSYFFFFFPLLLLQAGGGFLGSSPTSMLQGKGVWSWGCLASLLCL